MTYFEKLIQAFPDHTFLSEEALARYTTVGIGGPAEVFTRVQSSATLTKLVQFCFKQSIPVTILGWGANTLIADRGLRGLVIRNEAAEITVHETTPPELSQQISAQAPARWSADDTAGSFKYDLSDLQYEEAEQGAKRVLVTLASGVSLPMAINVLLAKGVTGLQWYARIPATVGGAIYNNIHGGKHFIGELVQSVTVVTRSGVLQQLTADSLEFGYDFSRFHKTDEVIISADFLLYQGEVVQARQIALEWAKRKQLQPQNSLGCIFQNISAEEQERLGVPTPSIGYLIEHKLELQNYRVGDAMVSPKHAAFIENTGSATAAEYLSVIKTICTAAEEKLALKLKPEIFFLGFTNQELTGIV